MSNRLSMLTMKRVMSYTVPGGIPSCDNAKQFLNTVEQNVRQSKKAVTGNLLSCPNPSTVDRMMFLTLPCHVSILDICQDRGMTIFGGVSALVLTAYTFTLE